MKNTRIVNTCAAGHPIALELYHGRIGPGDDVESLIARTTLTWLEGRGAYVDIAYYPRGPLPPGTISFSATVIMAKDGKLAYAASYDCTYQRTYFDLLRSLDHQEFGRLLHQFPGRRRAG